MGLTFTSTGTFLRSDATAGTSDIVRDQLGTCVLDKTWNGSDLFVSMWICYSKTDFSLQSGISFISSGHGMVWYGMVIGLEHRSDVSINA